MLISSYLYRFYIKAFISKTISTDPQQFAIKTLFTHFIVYKELNQLLLKKNPFALFLLLSLLSITSIAFHLNDIAAIIVNGELIQLITLAFSPHNISVLAYWFILLCFFFKTQFAFDSSLQQLKPIIKRKLFHFLISLLYVPAILFMSKVLLITLSLIVLYFFILIEELRNVKLASFQSSVPIKAINAYLKKNIDSRDDGKLIITHIFLLTGVLSGLFYSFNGDYDLISLIVLGIGDSFCSIIGAHWGKTFIYPPTKRTLEGTIGGLTASLIAFALMAQRLPLPNEAIAFMLIFIYEGITLEIDNLVLPLFSNILFVYISNTVIN